ncbi:hypothetical protein ACFSCZ_10835 [Siminovitchia sediminis]|uniref:Uncharacterized protein n=1 Tax=Siminovitchia sediminis TaxID=1274353 RepID=A0ABW4KJ01_9BACI
MSKYYFIISNSNTQAIDAQGANCYEKGEKLKMKNNIQVLPIVASIGIGAAAYSMMTGRGGQLQNMMPQLSNMGNQGASQQKQSTGTSS